MRWLSWAKIWWGFKTKRQPYHHQHLTIEIAAATAFEENILFFCFPEVSHTVLFLPLGLHFPLHVTVAHPSTLIRQRERNKAAPLCVWHDCLHRKCQGICKNNSSWNWVQQGWKIPDKQTYKNQSYFYVLGMIPWTSKLEIKHHLQLLR